MGGFLSSAGRPQGLRSRAVAVLAAACLLVGSAVVPAAAGPDRVFRSCEGMQILPEDQDIELHGYQFTTDDEGRPDYALARFGSLRDEPAPRDEQCEKDVGHYAGLGMNYDGGHLIGSQMYGPSVRENLVPMHRSVNRGVYLTLENSIILCLRQLNAGSLRYEVILFYPGDPLDVVPTTIQQVLTVENPPGTQNAVVLVLPNRQLSDPEKKAFDADLDKQLQVAGCG